MKTFFKDEILQKEYRDESFTHRIGIFNESAMAQNGTLYDDELCCWFDGLYTTLDFLDKYDKRFGNRKPQKSDDSYKKTNRKSSWTKFKSYDEAAKAMRENPEQFRKYTENDMKLTDAEVAGNQIFFDTQGDYLDVGKFLEGQPECFGVMSGGRMTRKFCSIVVNGSASANIKSDTINLKAEKVLRFVDMLESNGVRCEIGVIYETNEVHVEIIVKHYNDPVDLDSLGVVLSADFFRWMIFRLTEHSSLMSDTYGSPRGGDRWGDIWNDDDADCTVYIDSLRGCNDKEEVERSFEEFEKQFNEKMFSQKSYNVCF